MTFHLTDGSVHSFSQSDSMINEKLCVRLRTGGIGVVNLANLAGYTVYPGVAQIPADSWVAEPVSNSASSLAPAH